VWKEEKCVEGVGRETGKKKPFGRPWRRWEFNMKMDHKEVGWED